MILETERLRLREFTLDDTAFIIELLNSPGWLKFIGDRNVRTESEAIAYLENGPLKSYDQHGYGLSMVELKDRDKPVGMCGILNRDTLDTPDIGFAFLPEAQGKGYAYEIAAALLNHANTDLKIPVLAAITLPENKNSITLLEKLGFGFEKRFVNDGDEELALYKSGIVRREM
jgi:RimJ/RimL family protein N-acetyltransferase